MIVAGDEGRRRVRWHRGKRRFCTVAFQRMEIITGVGRRRSRRRFGWSVKLPSAGSRRWRGAMKSAAVCCTAGAERCGVRVYPALGTTDMRKGFNGLLLPAREVLRRIRSPGLAAVALYTLAALMFPATAHRTQCRSAIDRRPDSRRPWSERPDSNRRPLDPQSITKLRHAPARAVTIQSGANGAQLTTLVTPLLQRGLLTGAEDGGAA